MPAPPTLAPLPASASTPSPRHVGLAPVWADTARLLVLGSFPGVASLQAGQYYGHPRNHFWPILSALWADRLATPLTAMPYADRLAVVRANGVAIWDVYAGCERTGSLDSAIREPELNDLAGLVARSPQLALIAHNGGESARHMRLTTALGVPVVRLPSTSPANASWSFDRKLAAWRAAFVQAGIPVSGQDGGSSGGAPC